MCITNKSLHYTIIALGIYSDLAKVAAFGESVMPGHEDIHQISWRAHGAYIP